MIMKIFKLKMNKINRKYYFYLFFFFPFKMISFTNSYLSIDVTIFFFSTYLLVIFGEEHLNIGFDIQIKH